MMSADAIFSIANLLALGSWLLLAVFPRTPWLVDAIIGRAVPAIFALAYSIVVATIWWTADGGFSSLEQVGLLFTNPWMLLAGWIHYLAFDLLIGVWEVRDAAERRLPHLLVVPCLALTFLFGPAGWLLYVVIRTRAAGVH
jgi:Domain of unknown function (DUF4281)